MKHTIIVASFLIPLSLSGLTSAGDLGATVEANREPATIVTVTPPAEVMTRQGLPNFVGISGLTAGATGISMNVVRIPPGGAAKAHLHRDYETAVYLVQGRVETRFGEDLSQTVVNQAGDFIFIPANLPHQPRNLSQTEAAIAVVARTDPNEQENVIPYQVK